MSACNHCGGSGNGLGGLPCICRADQTMWPKTLGLTPVPATPAPTGSPLCLLCAGSGVVMFPGVAGTVHPKPMACVCQITPSTITATDTPTRYKCEHDNGRWSDRPCRWGCNDLTTEPCRITFELDVAVAPVPEDREEATAKCAACGESVTFWYRPVDVVLCARCNCRRLGHRVEALEEENKRLRGVIERERTAASLWIGRTRAAIRGSHGVATSRACYEWDDEEYRREFQWALDRIDKALEKAERDTNYRDLSDSPTTDAEVDAARAPLRAAAHGHTEGANG